MVHGVLEDEFEEFFIQRTAFLSSQMQTGESSSSQAALEWHKGFEVSRMSSLIHTLPKSVAAPLLQNQPGTAYTNVKR